MLFGLHLGRLRGHTCPDLLEPGGGVRSFQHGRTLPAPKAKAQAPWPERAKVAYKEKVFWHIWICELNDRVVTPTTRGSGGSGTVTAG